MIRIFKHYIPASLVLLSIAETLIFFVSIYIGTGLRLGGLDNVPADIQPLSVKALVFAVIMMMSLVAVGLYLRHLRDSFRGLVLRLGVAFFGGLVVMSLLFYVLPDLYLGRGAFSYALGLSLTGVIVARVIFFRMVNAKGFRRRILVVGAGGNAQIIETHLKRKTDRRGFVIVGYVPLPGETIVVDQSKLIPYNESLINLAEDHQVEEMVVAITDRRRSFPTEEILDCKMSGVDVTDVLSFMERQSRRIFLDVLQPSWLIFSDGFGRGSFRSFSKRVFDILASLLLLTVSAPFILLATVAIFLEDRGPVFYRQIRVGQNWKLVQIIKFRSMRVDAEKHGAQFAQQDDDRVTRVGKFIRKTRIDELPQLYNVLKGDMSFVGPRPERPEFVEKFSQTIPYYAERHRVKPGITGWAQISYPYGASEQDTVEKFQYDLYYVKNYSLFLDLTILLQTAEVILWGRGAR